MVNKDLEIYQPLPPETIRILDVRPAQDPKSELYCKLVDQRIPLRDERGRLKPIVEDELELVFEPYEALSYCWGADQLPSKYVFRNISSTLSEVTFFHFNLGLSISEEPTANSELSTLDQTYMTR